MLILSRKPGESLVIGDNISVTVLAIESGGNITLGIDAPKDLLILRKELQQAVYSNQEAATVKASVQIIDELEAVLKNSVTPDEKK